VARAADIPIQALSAIRRLLGSLAEGPVVIRARPSAAGLLRGRIDVVRAELRGVATSGLVVDEVVVRGTNVYVVPGLPARLRADSTTIGVTVLQRSVDRWLGSNLLPFAVTLDEDTLRGRTAIAGFSMGEIELEVATSGGWIVLRPRSATVMGVGAPGVGLFRGLLPLPRLPEGTRLDRVRHGPGRITLIFDTGPLDEPLTPSLGDRLRQRLYIGAGPPPDAPR